MPHKRANLHYIVTEKLGFPLSSFYLPLSAVQLKQSYMACLLDFEINSFLLVHGTLLFR